MATGLPIGEVDEDLQPKRMVIAAFNSQSTFMRCIVSFTINGGKIKELKGYWDFCRGTIARSDIKYLKGQESFMFTEEAKDI